MKKSQLMSVMLIILSATLYSISTPLSKILLNYIPPNVMATLLYLGAGIGMTFLGFIKKGSRKIYGQEHLTKRDLPYTIGIVVLDITAAVFLMIGLSKTTAANVSLLNNFEIVATSLIALCLFREPISKRLWFAIGLVTLSSIILSVEGLNSFSFSFGSIFVILACICWGLENNYTKILSSRNSLEIVVVKCLGTGVGLLIISMILGEKTGNIFHIICGLILGFVSYGLSIYLYVNAQRELGAAKTSTYYGITPFVGTILSLIIFKQIPNFSFTIALLIMIMGAYFAYTDNV